MDDSIDQRESAVNVPYGQEPASDEAPPQFGAVDIVEAFTAMRHEWRGQTKESRSLAEQIQSAVTQLQFLEAKLLAGGPETRPNGSSDDRELVLLIVDLDHQFSRAVAAIEQWEHNQRLREAADTRAVELYFEGMGRLARWCARPLLNFIAGQRHPEGRPEANPAVAGLNLVLARLRRAMHEQQIERLETAGQAFDAETMHAIGTVETADCPSGYVVEQLAPAYRWQGRLLRFADVRVAK